MPRQKRSNLAAVLVAVTAGATGCGAGKPVTPSSIPSSIEVRVSAGTPVSGATVTVYAVNDATGEVNTGAGAGGVLGSAGPTNESGRATVTLSGYAGPIQIVASGPALFYADPASPPDTTGSGSPVVIQIPSAFVLSSYATKFKSGPGGQALVPVTFLTTLADHAALAYARGLHSSHPGRTTITEALATRDPLLVTHITSAAAAWDPGALRTTAPAPLTAGTQSLVDGAFAALFDIALNQLAHDTAALAGYGSGAGGLTAPTLMQLLEEDLDADGRLDGRGQAGRVIATAGSTPVPMDAQFLRRPLAVALLSWVRNGQENRSGISDADLASAQVFRSITEDISDLFGPAPTEPFDPLDRTPPELSFVAPLPAYSANNSLRLVITAKDGSGTKAVHAQVGATRREAQLKDGTWIADVLLPSVGHNTIVVWAEDTAQPAPNSGAGLEPPYQLTVDVVYDPDAPTATYDSAFASYYDERGMTVATGPDFLALVPAVYSTAARTAIPNGAHIYKAATRLSAGGPSDAAEIEGVNGANVPVLRFYVSFNPRTDAPIATARYRVSVSCASCGVLPTAIGDLLPSPTVAPQALYFDLPLATESVPALASVTGPASLAVTLDLADAAGNTATIGGFGFTFHVIGPPLAVTEDTAYPGYGDPRSTFPYKIAGLTAGVDTYSTLFDAASPAFFGGQVRLVRYVVSNPSPEPVAVRPTYMQAPNGSWQVTEVWPRRSWVEEPTDPILSIPGSGKPYAIDGFMFYQATYWALPYGTVGAGIVNTETLPHPCGGYLNGWAAHRIGDTVSKWVCPGISPGAPTTTAVFSSSLVTPVVYAGFQQGGGEVLSPAQDTTGTTYLVPGAVGATPGTLVLYLTRPAAASRSRPLLMNLIGNVNAYETYDYELVWHSFTVSVTTRSGSVTYEVFRLMRSGQYLQSATESLAGSLVVTTQGLSVSPAGGTLLGEPATAFSTTYARTIATH